VTSEFPIADLIQGISLLGSISRSRAALGVSPYHFLSIKPTVLSLSTKKFFPRKKIRRSVVEGVFYSNSFTIIFFVFFCTYYSTDLQFTFVKIFPRKKNRIKFPSPQKNQFFQLPGAIICCV
jgi:hypothetical protein